MMQRRKSSFRLYSLSQPRQCKLRKNNQNQDEGAAEPELFSLKPFAIIVCTAFLSGDSLLATGGNRHYWRQRSVHDAGSCRRPRDGGTNPFRQSVRCTCVRHFGRAEGCIPCTTRA